MILESWKSAEFSCLTRSPSSRCILSIAGLGIMCTSWPHRLQVLRLMESAALWREHLVCWMEFDYSVMMFSVCHCIALQPWSLNQQLSMFLFQSCVCFNSRALCKTKFFVIVIFVSSQCIKPEQCGYLEMTYMHVGECSQVWTALQLVLWWLSGLPTSDWTSNAWVITASSRCLSSNATFFWETIHAMRDNSLHILLLAIPWICKSTCCDVSGM